MSRDMITSLIERVTHWSRDWPDHPAHESDGRSISYAQLERTANALAAEIAATVPDDGRPIAVRGHKDPAMLVGFVGCVKAGHPYIPIDSSTPSQRVERILASANVPLVLLASDEEVEMGTPTLRMGDATIPQLTHPHLPARAVSADAPHYVLYTSGSTGEPKGVIITHGCLGTFIDWMLEEHAWRPGEERVLNQAPFSFDLSVMDLSIALATGSTLVSITAEQIANPRLLYQELERSDLTAWVSTPSFAQMCLAERGFDATMLPRLRRFFFCGETLPPEVAAELLRRFPDAEVWNTYGPTEATVAVTSIRITDDILAQYPVLPVGRSMPAARVLVVTDSGQEAATGERGEIVIAGPNVSLGYLGRPDLTERAFFRHAGQRAYRTGDWGRYHDGLLFFEGRQDGQLKLHGYRIEIGDIEANLRALDEVRDALVLPVDREGAVESLVAFVIPATPLGESEFRAGRALRAALGTRLPAYMVPRTVRFMDAFPMTPNGKADRRALQESLR